MNLVPYSRKDTNLFRFMDDLERSFFNNAVSGTSQFRCDISERGNNYLLEAELPGFNKDDISVDINGDVLTVSAANNYENDEKDEDGNYIRRERRYGSYSRSFDISGIDASKITADYNNGVLELTLPKAKEIQPATRKVAIGGGSPAAKVEAKSTAKPVAKTKAAKTKAEPEN